MKHPVVIATLLIACAAPSCQKPESSPQQKVEQLKAEKAAKLDSSGYNLCVKQIKDEQERRERCVIEKLQASGYKDGTDCMLNPFAEPCKNIERYNAEVRADNDCAKEHPAPKLSVIDCAKLLEKE